MSGPLPDDLEAKDLQRPLSRFASRGVLVFVLAGIAVWALMMIYGIFA
jgi:hypothetical protein